MSILGQKTGCERHQQFTFPWKSEVSMTSLSPTLRQRFLLFLAEGFGLGRAPFAPGTWGSLPGVALCWALKTAAAGPAACLALWLLLFLVGIPLCRIAAEIRRRHDPGSIVWDEITAFPLLATVAEPGWDNLLLGFVLFRIFDISKPWPVKRFEQYPGGLGIMADDQVAGLYAAGVLWILQQLQLI
jgi:phosphatidylglycerophosphatase A